MGETLASSTLFTLQSQTFNFFITWICFGSSVWSSFAVVRGDTSNDTAQIFIFPTRLYLKVKLFTIECEMFVYFIVLSSWFLHSLVMTRKRNINHLSSIKTHKNKGIYMYVSNNVPLKCFSAREPILFV